MRGVRGFASRLQSCRRHSSGKRRRSTTSSVLAPRVVRTHAHVPWHCWIRWVHRARTPPSRRHDSRVQRGSRSTRPDHSNGMRRPRDDPLPRRDRIYKYDYKGRLVSRQNVLTFPGGHFTTRTRRARCTRESKKDCECCDVDNAAAAIRIHSRAHSGLSVNCHPHAR